ncbi:MAG: hypothetical protein GVY32_04895, partial [Gammaproteobacteria bacterium]|nr:hypothetical protein [Gammaproteobacteria bacterium]
MSFQVFRAFCLLAVLVLFMPAGAQEAEPEIATETGEAGAESQAQAQPAEEAGEESAPVAAQAPSLEQAYQKEFAFLQGQKRDLERRIADFEAASEADLEQLQVDIRSLERQVVEATSRGDRLEDQVFESERSVESARDNVNLLANTFLQAEAT